MTIHVTNLDQLNMDSLINFLDERGWEVQTTYLKESWVYEKKKEGKTYQILLLSKYYSDWERRMQETLETLLSVEEVTLPVTIKRDKVFKSIAVIDVKDINDCLKC